MPDSFDDNIPTATTASIQSDHSTTHSIIPNNGTTPLDHGTLGISPATPGSTFATTNITDSTTSANQQAKHSGIPQGAVIGIVLGSLGAVLVIIAIVFHRRRRRRNTMAGMRAPIGDVNFRNRALSDRVDPFPVHVHQFIPNHTRSEQWAITSDSKRTVLDGVATRLPHAF